MTVSRNGNGSHRSTNAKAGAGDIRTLDAGTGYLKPVLITGGAGFVGTNVADRLLRAGRKVIVYDNLSRAGVEANLRWLRATHGSRLTFVNADVRDAKRVRECVALAAQVFHFAAQVAVTTSVENPCEDFEINARGTLNVLEAVRAQPVPPAVVFTSTNKVYGNIADVPLRRNHTRYMPSDAHVREYGISEERLLDFHSPYGCSKGAADQYVLDHARSYGLPTVVFRMSCIYGPHQFGTEDQGWVAHFALRALQGKPITIYGDGMQVRDILFVEDLVDAFMLALEKIDALSGEAFNIGGGPTNTISLRELLTLLAELIGREPAVRYDGWRTGDQRYYVSDTRKFQRATGWRPHVEVREGVARLYHWLADSRPVASPAKHMAA